MSSKYQAFSKFWPFSFCDLNLIGEVILSGVFFLGKIDI